MLFLENLKEGIKRIIFCGITGPTIVTGDLIYKIWNHGRMEYLKNGRECCMTCGFFFSLPITIITVLLSIIISPFGGICYALYCLRYPRNISPPTQTICY